jgi:N-acetylglucosaminyl-diphospho-decaprenol L-rhamnosyltransferase
VSDALTVVMIHHRQPDKCLGTVSAFLDQAAGIRVIVVDNGSDPTELDRLRHGLPDGVELLALGANRGFGPAANAGLRRWLSGGSGEWALVAPHDARPAPGAVRLLLEVAGSRRRAGLACAEYGDDTRPVVDPYLGGMVVPLDGAGPWVSTTHPHGTLLGLRRACLEQVGLFDERYFAYVEEADLALRAAAAGWEAGMVIGAVVANPGTNVVRPVVEYLQTRNTLLLVKEHFGAYHGLVRVCIAAGSTVYQTIRPSRRAAWFDAPVRWRAIADHLRHHYGPPPAHLFALPPAP